MTAIPQTPVSSPAARDVTPAQLHSERSALGKNAPRQMRIGKTLPFNGYADKVASLYSGMDLRKNY